MKQAENTVGNLVPIVQYIRRFGSLVRFSHSVFALPFALSMLVVVAETRPVTIFETILILGCVVSARTAAMGYNRIRDRLIDAQNPRTSGREIPSGVVSLSSVWGLVIVSSSIFIVLAGLFGMHTLILSPLVLAVLFFYSWTKRFTGASHLVLGVCLAMAPGGVWYALQEQFAWEPVPLMLSVLCWVSGFDILYSMQDDEFDRRSGLHSIPVYLGREKAFRVAQALHIVTTFGLITFGAIMDRGPLYYAGVGLFAVLLASQYRVISPDSLERINEAFFVRNGTASILLFLFTAADSLCF